MGWIDYKKAYDMIPHSWILEMLGLVKVADNVKGLLSNSMGDWKTVLTASGDELGEVDIKPVEFSRVIPCHLSYLS